MSFHPQSAILQSRRKGQFPPMPRAQYLARPNRGPDQASCQDQISIFFQIIKALGKRSGVASIPSLSKACLGCLALCAYIGARARKDLVESTRSDSFESASVNACHF